jgi:hypothetical protein
MKVGFIAPVPFLRAGDAPRQISQDATLYPRKAFMTFLGRGASFAIHGK